MKTILVLTDLSDKAAHAAEAAVKISEKLKADVILYHVFPVVEAFSVSGAGMWPVDDYSAQENDSLYALKVLAEDLKNNVPAQSYQPKITIKNKGGNLNEQLEQLLKEVKPDLIVMGAKSVDRLGHFLIGSESNTVLHKANCPVLFIPETYLLTSIDRIVLAVDLEEVQTANICLLTDLARGYDAEIILTHITASEDEAKLGFKGCTDIITKTCNYPKVSSKCLVSKDVKTELLEIPDLLKADLLVMVHHKLGFWNRIFTDSKTKHVLKKQQVPLLVLPG